MKNRARRLTGFTREHKTLACIFVLGLFLYIRNSDIPFWDNVPMFIRVVFLKNEIPGVSEMIKGIALSLIASTVFYYIVNYCPEYESKERAKSIVSQQMRTLFTELGFVVESYRYVAKEQRVTEYDSILYDIREEYYVKKIYGDGYQNYWFIKLEDDCRIGVQIALRICDYLIAIPEISYLDEKLRACISEFFINQHVRYTLGNNRPTKTARTKNGADDAIKCIESLLCEIRKQYCFQNVKIEKLSEKELNEYKRIISSIDSSLANDGTTVLKNGHRIK